MCSPDQDLKQQGLLDDTLIVWEASSDARPWSKRVQHSAEVWDDHHPQAFTMWFAGGGIRRVSPSVRRTNWAHVVEQPIAIPRRPGDHSALVWGSTTNA
ncbi:MAG: DUF1501 domain-containing protein [Planctomycetaceae bacterium]